MNARQLDAMARAAAAADIFASESRPRLPLCRLGASGLPSAVLTHIFVVYHANDAWCAMASGQIFAILHVLGRRPRVSLKPTLVRCWEGVIALARMTSGRSPLVALSLRARSGAFLGLRVLWIGGATRSVGSPSAYLSGRRSM